MDIYEFSRKPNMRALPKGVAVGLQLAQDGKTISIPAVYATGVAAKFGQAHYWVFWELNRFVTRDNIRFWTARAYKQLESGFRPPLQLQAFGGHSGVDAERLSDLLVAIGVGLSIRKPSLLSQTMSFIVQEDSTCDHTTAAQVRQTAWYFSPAMAEQAREDIEKGESNTAAKTS